jgi:predicted Zn-dependent protease
MNGKLFRVVGVGTDEHRETMRASLFSLRPLTAAELAAVRVTTLRLATARAGETIEQLCARTGNEFPIEITTTMNGVERGAPLAAGQLIKIARREPHVRGK